MEAVCLTPSATNNRWSPLLGNNLIPNTGKWSAGNNKYCKTAYDFWMLQSYEERGEKTLDLRSSSINMSVMGKLP